MNETLILLLGDHPGAPVRWAFWGDSRVQLADTGASVASLSAIATRAGAARQVVGVLPGEDVAMRVMPTPPRSAAQFRAAAGFLLEDELAESLSGVHVATARHESGAGFALAVKTPVMEAWSDAFTQAGISLDVLTADFAMLPLARGCTIIVDTAARVVGAAGLRGFAVARPLADELVSTLLDDDDLSEVVIYGEHKIDIPSSEALRVDWRGPATDEALFALYAGVIETGGAPPNLLQGAYRKRREWRASFAPWRRAAALAAASLLGFAFLSAADGVRSLRIADQLEADTLALHQLAFPDAGNVDPRAHARAILASGGAQSVFLPVSTLIATSLEENENVQLDRIRYNAARGEFSVNLRFADISELEALKRTLAARGVTATETGGVLRSGGVFLGELRVVVS